MDTVSTKKTLRRHTLTLFAVLGLVCAGFIVVGNVFLIVMHDARDRMVDTTVRSLPKTLGEITVYNTDTPEVLSTLVRELAADTTGVVDTNVFLYQDGTPQRVASLHDDDLIQYAQYEATLGAHALPKQVTVAVRDSGYIESSYVFTDGKGVVLGYVEVLFKQDLFALPVERNIIRATILLLSVLCITFILLVWFIGAGEHKRLLTQTTQKAKLHDELLGKVVHEVQTPLTVIAGYTTMLSGLDVDANAKQYVLRISSAVQQLQRFIRNAEYASRFEQQQLSFAYERVNPVAVVHAVVEDVQKKYAYMKPQISFTTQSTDNIHVDHKYLAFVVEEVLLNAMQHGGGESNVRVRTEGSDVLIIISDAGQGMDEEAVKNVVKKWHRSTGDYKRLRGSGLGMWLVQKLVLKMKGGVDVVSAPEKGTTVTLRFPRSL